MLLFILIGLLGCSNANLYLNEWLANSGLNSEDWIEVYSNDTTITSLENYYLTDDPKSANPQNKFKYKIPGQQTVSPNGFWSIFQNNGFVQPYFGTPTTGTNSQGLGFGLSALGETFALFDDLGATLDSVSYEGSQVGQTIGRWIVSTGADKYTLLSRPTKGSANAYPYVSQVIFTEVMYQPPPNQPQFVTIYNRGSTPVSLFGNDPPKTPWKIRGLSFDFPANTVLQPGQSAFICSSNVSKSSFESAWVSKISVLSPVPQIFCNWTGNLSTDGEKLELLSIYYDSATPGIASVPEDTVKYTNLSDSANGKGDSLQRLSFVSFGEEPLNWVVSSSIPQSCSKPSDCRTVDNCTVADCSSGNCTYRLSNLAPICGTALPSGGGTTASSTASTTSTVSTSGTTTTSNSNPSTTNSTSSNSGLERFNYFGVPWFGWLGLIIGLVIIIVLVIVIIVCCCRKKSDDFDNHYNKL